MKSFKLLLAGLVLCASQAAFAITGPQQLALDSALASVSVDVSNQSLVNAAINAAAAAGVSVEQIVTQLNSLGVSPSLITAAISTNISLSGGYTAAALNVANTTLTLLSAGGSTGAGGGQGGSTGGQGSGLGSLGGGFTTGGFTGGPNGAISVH